MDIPYTNAARPDTGLYNAKVGIWLFLASEVMLFGGLFSAYIFLRLDSLPGHWPHGLLNVPVGTMNTAILIASSVTVQCVKHSLLIIIRKHCAVYTRTTNTCIQHHKIILKLYLKLCISIVNVARCTLPMRYPSYISNERVIM
jgi:hypothetical protein